MISKLYNDIQIDNIHWLRALANSLILYSLYEPFPDTCPISEAQVKRIAYAFVLYVWCKQSKPTLDSLSRKGVYQQGHLESIMVMVMLRLF